MLMRNVRYEWYVYGICLFSLNYLTLCTTDSFPSWICIATVYWPRSYKLFLCSTQLSMKFVLLINLKLLTIAPASVVQLDARPTGDKGFAGSTSAGSVTFFHGDWSWNTFYGHSLPSANSIRAVVNFWRKNVHNTGQPLRGQSLPSKIVVT